MTLETIIQQAKQLTPWEKMRLIQAISPDIEKALIQTEKNLVALYGEFVLI